MGSELLLCVCVCFFMSISFLFFFFHCFVTRCDMSTAFVDIQTMRVFVLLAGSDPDRQLWAILKVKIKRTK